MGAPRFGRDDVEHDVQLPGGALPWPVHRVGEGPPVIVMHELLGMTPTYLSFCYRLAAAGFSVWMPQLVGAFPSSTPAQQAAAVGAICISREIDVLRAGRTSPLATPLRALSQTLSTRQGGGPVGVVGMCLSGGFALALAAHPSVSAAVVAQPAIPFRTFCGRALGLSREDVDTIRDRLAAGEVEVYYTRFAQDPISPRSRMTAAARQLGTQGLHAAQLPPEPFGVLDHSVLTAAPAAYADKEGAEPQRRLLAEAADAVSAFLTARLAP